MAEAVERNRRVVVELKLPFSIERRGWPEREHVVGWNSKAAREYLAALRAEIRANAAEFADCSVAAIRLDGGIATNVPGEDLWHAMQELRACMHVEDGAPMSARAALSNISGASMPYLRRAGVSRFDFELLALDNADFARLNHADAIQDMGYVVDDFLHAYSNKTLGIVLAYGFDAPNTAAFRRTMIQFTRMPAHHLLLEPWKGACVAKAPDDLAAAQLEQARDVLGNAGFVEYAPLAFAKPGEEDPFWSLRTGAQECELIGFGLGAATEFGGARSTNTSDWETYVQNSGDFTKITAAVEQI